MEGEWGAPGRPKHKMRHEKGGSKDRQAGRNTDGGKNGDVLMLLLGLQSLNHAVFH